MHHKRCSSHSGLTLVHLAQGCLLLVRRRLADFSLVHRDGGLRFKILRNLEKSWDFFEKSWEILKNLETIIFCAKICAKNPPQCKSFSRQLQKLTWPKGHGQRSSVISSLRIHAAYASMNAICACGISVLRRLHLAGIFLDSSSSACRKSSSYSKLRFELSA